MHSIRFRRPLTHVEYFSDYALLLDFKILNRIPCYYKAWKSQDIF